MINVVNDSAASLNRLNFSDCLSVTIDLFFEDAEIYC